MKLQKEPRCPTQYELATRAAKMVPKRVHNTWKPFLGFSQQDIADEFEMYEDGDDDEGDADARMSEKKP